MKYIIWIDDNIINQFKKEGEKYIVKFETIEQLLETALVRIFATSEDNIRVEESLD